MSADGVADQERGFDQLVDPAPHLGFILDIPGTDRERLFFVEGARKYRQQLQDLAAVRVEQLVGPFQRLPQRLMAAGPAPENARLQVERLGHAAFNALQAMPPQLRGRDLDRERNAIEIGANSFNGGKIVRTWLKSAIAGRPPLFEQAGGRGWPGARRAPVVRIQRKYLVEGLALHPKRAPAGVDQEQFAAGRTEFGD